MSFPAFKVFDNQKGQFNIVSMAVGVGLFIFVLGIIASMLGETETAMDSQFSSVNSTLSEGRDAMKTGSKFGTVLIVLGILGVAIAIFSRMGSGQ